MRLNVAADGAGVGLCVRCRGVRVHRLKILDLRVVKGNGVWCGVCLCILVVYHRARRLRLTPVYALRVPRASSTGAEANIFT